MGGMLCVPVLGLVWGQDLGGKVGIGGRDEGKG